MSDALDTASATSELRAPDSPAGGRGPAGRRRIEHRLARVLTTGMLAGIVLLAAGVLGMAATGTRPFGGGAPDFDLRRLPGDLGALRPGGFLWLGLIVVVATPSARVAGSLAGFLLQGDRRMALVAAAVLVVIALSAAVGWIGG